MKTAFSLRLGALLLFLLFIPCAAQAEKTGAESVYTVTDEAGQPLFAISTSISVGDEYISRENMLYRVTSVSGAAAQAERIGEEPMPDVSWLDLGEAQPVFAQSDESAVPAAKSGAKSEKSDKKRLIAMYVTHSDESYVPSDGTQSIEGQGGIYDVARAFRDALQKEGIDVILDESTHLPHD